MFEKFRLGSTHLAFVIELVETNGETDPYEKCVGVVTLHDVFEAITSCDINDELRSDTDKGAFGVNYLKKLIKTKYSNNNQKSVKEIALSNKISIDQEIDDGPSSTSTICSTGSEASLNSGSDVHCISLQTKLAILQILTSKKHFYKDLSK